MIIVYKSKNFIFAAFYIVLSDLKSFNNGQKLTVRDLISSFT